MMPWRKALTPEKQTPQPSPPSPDGTLTPSWVPGPQPSESPPGFHPRSGSGHVRPPGSWQASPTWLVET